MQSPKKMLCKYETDMRERKFLLRLSHIIAPPLYLRSMTRIYYGCLKEDEIPFLTGTI